MSPRLLLIGASGHIGAAVLELIHKAHPNLAIAVLVRSRSDAKQVEVAYDNNVKTVQGSLEDLNLVEREAAVSDLVINCAPDVPHTAGLTFLLRGLAANNAKKFYIHTSGAARIWPAPSADIHGPAFTRTWDDLADLNSLPSDTTHAAQDILVQSASRDNRNVFTAIVSPSFVVGKSPSVTHKPPIIFPDMVHVIREAGGVFTVATGENKTTFVDTEDLARLYLLLVHDALRLLEDQDAAPDGEMWGERAYYFADSIELSFRETMSGHLGPVLRKHTDWIITEEVAQLSLEKVVGSILGRVQNAGVDFEGANLWSRHIAEGFGTAMRVRGSRARKYLGWKPERRVDWEAAVRAMVAEENVEGEATGRK